MGVLVCWCRVAVGVVRSRGGRCGVVGRHHSRGLGLSTLRSISSSAQRRRSRTISALSSALRPSASPRSNAVLADPVPQNPRADPELAGDLSDRPSRLPDDPHSTGPEIRVILASWM